VASVVLAGDRDGSAPQSGAASGTVSITTDASNYAPGDPFTTTVTNGTTTPIAPLGGIVCQGSPWPFGVQRLDDTGAWQDAAFPRSAPCIGIAVALLGPGESQIRSFAADASTGTYRVVYAYSATDGSGQTIAVSDPYDVDAAPMGPADGTGSVTPPVPVSPLGYLEGQVAIGPLQPVERVGVPSPTPPPPFWQVRSGGPRTDATTPTNFPSRRGSGCQHKGWLAGRLRGDRASSGALGYARSRADGPSHRSGPACRRGNRARRRTSV
jgi:hypothetical protein